MEPFPVDIDPKQIVRWIVAEHRITPLVAEDRRTPHHQGASNPDSRRTSTSATRSAKTSAKSPPWRPWRSRRLTRPTAG